MKEDNFQGTNVSPPYSRENNITNIPPVIYISAQTKRHYTWSETKAAGLNFGATLHRLWDWKKGDVLGLFSPNCIDSPAIVFGTLWSGGTISAANPAYTVDELAFQLKDSHAKALVTQLACLDVATKAAQIAGIPNDRIILIGDDLDTTDQFKHFSVHSNMRFEITHCQKPTIDPKRDLALLAYSSGTTGRPKAVMLSHENLVSNLLQIQATDEGNLNPTGGDNDHGDKILATVPYFHVYGIYAHSLLSRTMLTTARFLLPDFDAGIQRTYYCCHEQV